MSAVPMTSSNPPGPAAPPPGLAARVVGPRPSALLLTENEALCGGPPNLFAGLSAAERSRILADGRKKVLYRGATLFSQGSPHDGIYVVETGRIRVFYMSPAGREITLAYWSPGHFVGGPDIFGGGVHQWSGMAAANSSVVFLSGRTLRDLIMEVPRFGIALIEGLAFKGRCYSALVQMLGTRSVTERLAHLLLHLTESYGVAEEGGIAIAASFTHADLAHMVGATRQWVTISLKKLQERDVLVCRKAGILVRRPDILAEMRGQG